MVSNKDIKRSYYDPIEETMYLTPENLEEPEVIAHELIHHRQNLSGTNNATGVPFLRPTMPTTEEASADYHNRKFYDVQRYLQAMRENHSDTRFMPDDYLYDKIIDANLYNDPETSEGEAQFYQKQYSETDHFKEESAKMKAGLLYNKNKNK